MINCGVYLIRNKIVNKIYVGSSIDLRRRWRVHKSKLNNKQHPSKYLQSSWNKYGEHNFEFIILEEVQDKTKLIEREQYWMDFYKSYDRNIGYNSRIIAISNLGWHHTDETKRQISIKSTGRIITDETRKKLSTALMGKHSSEESKQKNREWHFMRKQSPESIEKRINKIRKVKVPVVCLECNSVIYKLPGQAKRTKFCSTVCQLNALHKKLKGHIII